MLSFEVIDPTAESRLSAFLIRLSLHGQAFCGTGFLTQLLVLNSEYSRNPLYPRLPNLTDQ